jgi:XTP/dITP diphosphohydrolase
MGKIGVQTDYNTLKIHRQSNQTDKVGFRRQTMENSLLIATGNPGKIREFNALLSSLSIQVLDTRVLSLAMDIPEVGHTYQENALIKARAYTEESGLVVLADDSGLEVDVLEGEPGLYSARYAPQIDATDADRRYYLLSKLKGLPQPWTAHFHCTAVLMTPDGEVFTTEGKCPGIIIPEERGDGGFGYDPIFYLPDHQATMAEISAGLKNEISHRARAIISMLPYIHKVFNLK